jgi:hypothetical protein
MADTFRYRVGLASKADLLRLASANSSFREEI